MAELTELNRISITIIVYYTPALIAAFYLCKTHGVGRSSGWVYLALFATVRIISGALDLATIGNLNNTGLLVGANTMQTIGLSPLILAMLGLLSRVLEGIRFKRPTIATPRHIRFVQLIVLVGLILGIVGGVKLGDIISTAISTGSLSGYAVPSESSAGIGLMAAGYGLLALLTLITAKDINAAVQGERRLLLAIALSMPFVLVRLVFSAESIFSNDPDFRVYFGSDNYPDYFLGMAVIMEMAAIFIIESISLTLQKFPRVVSSQNVGEEILLGTRPIPSEL